MRGCRKRCYRPAVSEERTVRSAVEAAVGATNVSRPNARSISCDRVRNAWIGEYAPARGHRGQTPRRALRARPPQRRLAQGWAAARPHVRVPGGAVDAAPRTADALPIALPLH